MSVRGRSEDLATLLYLVPFVAGIVYGLVLWIQEGISLLLPTSVFLTVTRDPYLFTVGSLAIAAAVVVELNGAEPRARPAKLVSLGSTPQSIAAASLVFVLICAFYANGFTDATGAVTDFIVGKYGLVFPALLVLFSYLVTAQFRFAALGNRRVLATIAMLLVPASLYEIGKRETVLGLLIALFFLLAGLALYLMPERKPKAQGQG